MRFALILLSLWPLLSLAQSQPVGFYTDGTLENGQCLPPEGVGYTVFELSRNVGRIWGTNPLVQTIVCGASEMNTHYPNRDRLQVEDMSARHGGDISTHASHENGLDVDLQYFKADGQEHRPTAAQRYAPPMVASGRVIANFDVERNWQLAKALHRCGNVAVIFMDRAIKNRLCQYARSTGDYAANIQVLRSIRHSDNHQDHLHMRLKCPPRARRCISQSPPPPGSGCP